MRAGLINISMNRTEAPYPENLPAKFPVRVAYVDEDVGYKGLFAESVLYSLCSFKSIPIL